MKLYVFVLFCFALLLLNGCAVSSTYGHIENYNMDVSPAPELRGAGAYIKNDSASLRLSGHINMGPSGKDKRSGIKNDLSGCSGLVNCDGFDSVYVDQYVNAEYEMVYPYVTASLDYVHKWELVMMGFGFGLDKGAFFDVMLGFNTKYFEMGAVAGMWMIARSFRYSGTEYECTKFAFSDDELTSTWFSSSNGTGITFFYGGYATVFVGAFSLNVSFDVYRPDPAFSENDDVIANFDFPLVLTGYATAGYRINKNWEVRLGAVNFTSKFPDKHISVNGGASYYL